MGSYYESKGRVSEENGSTGGSFIDKWKETFFTERRENTKDAQYDYLIRIRCEFENFFGPNLTP